MVVTTYLLTTGWYEEFLKFIPDGKLFSLRAVFEAIPGILQNLPITLLLTAGGAVFGILLAMVFAIVKINRVKVLYPIQASGPAHADLFWDSFIAEGYQSEVWHKL